MSFQSIPALKVKKEHRHLILLHWLSLPLIIAILGVGAYRSLGLKGTTPNRMEFVVISAAAKSLIFLAYILGTSHISYIKHRYSARAVLVLSTIDTLFWIAALGLTAYGMIQIASSGTRAILNYVLIALLAVMFLVSLPVLYLAFRQDRHVRLARREQEGPEVEMVQDEYIPRK